MTQLVGLLLLANSLAFTTWWVATGQPGKVYVISLCLVAVSTGLFLLLKDRIAEITVQEVGTIKAAADQATVDAKQISEIRQQVGAQSATFDLVAKQAEELQQQASDIKKLSGDIVRKHYLADEKLAVMDQSLQKASNAVSGLQMITDFAMTVVAAQNDDRKAFDQLTAWNKDKSHSFSSYASQALNTIMDEHAKPYFLVGFSLSWPQGVTPKKLTIEDLKKIYEAASSTEKPAYLEFIWNRQDIPKKTRMQFLADVIQRDQSLTAVEYAGRYFAEGAQLKSKPLAVESMLNWWSANKEKME